MCSPQPAPARPGESARQPRAGPAPGPLGRPAGSRRGGSQVGLSHLSHVTRRHMWFGGGHPAVGGGRDPAGGRWRRLLVLQLVLVWSPHPAAGVRPLRTRKRGGRGGSPTTNSQIPRSGPAPRGSAPHRPRDTWQNTLGPPSPSPPFAAKHSTELASRGVATLALAWRVGAGAGRGGGARALAGGRPGGLIGTDLLGLLGKKRPRPGPGAADGAMPPTEGVPDSPMAEAGLSHGCVATAGVGPAPLPPLPSLSVRAVPPNGGPTPPRRGGGTRPPRQSCFRFDGPRRP